ncbi:glutathione S-transferase [Pholiota conissans]|uniref:glutathione transferase n=1 Tax=Pholiota conissans TaxID=109636 RepID=A0A9P6CPG6_9AGAR|nr:glutathione S-transferase [Pholiota conissans]
MVVKLYGHNLLSNTRLVALILHEKKVPFEFHLVNRHKKEHKTPEHKKKHPFGLLPYIDDDGFILYESRAITYYIANKYAKQGAPLIPTEVKANALFHQAASMELSYFNQYAKKAVHEVIINPTMKGIPTNRAAFDHFIVLLSENLDVYDKILSKHRYLTGDDITLADLHHLPMAAWLPVAGSNVLETKPNVHRWFNEMSWRPSWQAVKGDIQGTIPTRVVPAHM